MLRREEKPAKLEVYECCGRTRDPWTQGRFRLAQTDTWLCAACFDKAIAERDASREQQREAAEVSP